MKETDINISKSINKYLMYCENQKCLDGKTIRAYRIDLNQFENQASVRNLTDINISVVEGYISWLHSHYKPRSAKRKIASCKAFFHYLERKDIIAENPFRKADVSFRLPVELPKTIPLSTIESILRTVYAKSEKASTPYRQRNAIRDAAMIELLFATGIRISELCALSPSSVDLDDATIRIYGKGAKERLIHIGNEMVIATLKAYAEEYQLEIRQCGHFFANQSGNPLSDQSARRIIRQYTESASVSMHITPHMFRHTFASSLLDQDVDIRYIQEMLGHSSIRTTEIYTHVSLSKQKRILRNKHPRNTFSI